jgi:hypothetical protein
MAYHYYVNDRKQEDSALFDLKEFIEQCKDVSASTVKELIQEALRDPVSVKAALDAEFAGGDLSKGNLANLI